MFERRGVGYVIERSLHGRKVTDDHEQRVLMRSCEIMARVVRRLGSVRDGGPSPLRFFVPR